MVNVVLASNNAGKIREFSAILAPFNITIIPQSEFNVPEIEETGATFIENALLKARHASKLTGLPAIGDDSGIAVHALNGAPGILSARYAGEPANPTNNIQKLLIAMKEVPDDKRMACFHCILVFLSYDNDPTPLVCEGRWHGMITKMPSGNRGFGYDPVFYVPSEQKTAAELSPERKNALSHRGRAIQSLLAQLAEKI